MMVDALTYFTLFYGNRAKLRKFKVEIKTYINMHNKYKNK